MPLVKYVLTVGVLSTEHPADLVSHVRAALEAATGINEVLDIAPLPLAASPSPSTPPPAPAIPRNVDPDDEDDEPDRKSKGKNKLEKSNN